MRRGFTLVELAIVLVIVGLLIGGILVAQSMTSTAKVTKFTGQIQQYDAAIGAFYSIYKNLPGDTPALALGGNGDGVISDGLMECCGTSYTREFKGENASFWGHLQIAGLREPNANYVPLGNVGGTAPRSIQPNPTIPNAAIAENTGIVPYTVKTTTAANGWAFGNWTVYLANATPPANYYFVTHFTGANSHGISWNTNTALYWRESIRVDDARAIDKKMDDGNARAGKVLNGSYMEGATYNTGCAANGWANNYSSSSTGLCALMIQMPSF